MAKDRDPGVKQLDYAINFVLGFIALVAILAAVSGLSKNISDLLPELNPNLSNLLPSLYSWMPPMSALGFLLYLIPIYLIYRYFRNKNALAAAPDDQPFKVNVAIVPIEDSKLLKIIRGRALTHNLSVKVDIGLKDWERIKKAGLYDAVLFEYPDPTSTYSGEMREYNVRDLKIHGAAPFYNLNQAMEAKETLLKNIVNLRATVEAQKEGPQVTSFEI
jgi:hypothetical protein